MSDEQFNFFKRYLVGSCSGAKDFQPVTDRSAYTLFLTIPKTSCSLIQAVDTHEFQEDYHSPDVPNSLIVHPVQAKDEEA